MHAHQLIRVIGVGLSVVLALVSPAAADSPGGNGPNGGRDQLGWTDGVGIGAEATSPGDLRAPHGRPASKHAGPTCTYAPLSANNAAVAQFIVTHDPKQQPPTGPVNWYSKVCVDAGGNSTGTITWFPVPKPAPPTPGLAGLAAQVVRYMPIPAPGIEMNPPVTKDELVALPIWLWVDPAGWKPISTSATAAGATVQVVAVPLQVVWNMGNGDRVVCGPGIPYDAATPLRAQSTNCSYTYRSSSSSQAGGTYQVTATAEWHATWTVAGAPGGGGDLGVIDRTATTSVVVAEAQAVNTIPSP